MKNPPDFVMYVAMVKWPGTTTFEPHWYEGNPAFVEAFKHKKDAAAFARLFKRLHGKKNRIRSNVWIY